MLDSPPRTMGHFYYVPVDVSFAPIFYKPKCKNPTHCVVTAKFRMAEKILD